MSWIAWSLITADASNSQSESGLEGVEPFSELDYVRMYIKLTVIHFKW